jgi:trk system potassium uptake protein
VTGLASTDISRFSLFGELVIMALIQVGGFGIMTIGSVLAIVASHRMGLRQRMLAQAEIGAVDMGDLRRLILAIAKITSPSRILALILFLRFWQAGYEDGPIASAYSGIFHSIASFNNAGFSLYSDNLAGFVTDPSWCPQRVGWIHRRWPRVPDPRRVLAATAQRRSGVPRPAHWTLHTKITC